MTMPASAMRVRWVGAVVFIRVPLIDRRVETRPTWIGIHTDGPTWIGIHADRPTWIGIHADGSM
jgi:hypothetical protein